MGNTTVNIEETNIVLLGHFNPPIFRPEWFASCDLIGEEEAAQANIEIIHAEVVKFSVDWVQVEIQRNRFLARSLEEPLVRLYDFVMGTFSRLKDTPIGQMGINRNAHIGVDSLERWHAIGDTLTPKKVWSELFERPEEPRWGGMASLTMQLDKRDTDANGYTRVKVAPSARVVPGIFVDVNDHYQIENPQEATGCGEILDMLKGEWTRSVQKSADYINKVANIT